MNRFQRLNKSVQDTKRLANVRTSGRSSIRSTALGSDIGLQQLRPHPVFVLRTEGGYAVVKDAINQGGRYYVEPLSDAEYWVELPPNYTAEHFKPFVIGIGDDGEPLPGWDGQPTENDQYCVVEAGLLEPRYRFAIANPVDVDDLCGAPEPLKPSEPPLTEFGFVPPTNEKAACAGCAKDGE